MKNIIGKSLLALLTFAASISGVAAEIPFLKGEPLPDTEGKHVNAHGGNIMKVGDTYYWYGEHRGDGTPGSGQLGVALYTSTDLKNWQNRGIVLSVVDREGDSLEKGCTIERPKVVYCPATGKYVMWFHHELKGKGYSAAMAGVATADSPEGPFIHLGSGRVNPGVLPVEFASLEVTPEFPTDLEWWTPEWREAVADGMFVYRDLEGGQMARDMTIYIDDDGTAYHIYSSEDNLTLHIAQLDSTFTHHTGKYTRLAPAGHNEAPTLFKKDGVYWMITSGCTGWDPNAARLMKATSLMGPWEQLPNPCRGDGADTTFDSQGTYIMENGGKFIFMADRWNPKKLCDSRHLWIPVSFDADGTPYLSFE